MKVNERYHQFYSTLFLSLVSLSFVLSDWMIGLFTFSEYILGFIVTLLVVIGNFKMSRIQIKWILGIVIFLIAHMIMQKVFNEYFVLKVGFAAFIKLIFYIVIILSLYNYILENRLLKKFLLINNFFAIITCLIGLYIVIAIYSDGVLPFEFLWSFTRSDVTSYIFNNGVLSFVRMRSVFSEPSYFGFYLNTILAMNYLNSSQIKINRGFSLGISFAILLTLSYSAIAIMLLTTILYIFSKKKQWLKNNKQKNMGLILMMIVIAFLVYVLFQDFFNHVFIQRTIDIFTDTDNSGYSRLFGSWKYVNASNFLLGNGLGHTPAIWNIYAYMLSDLGIFGLVYYIVVTLFVLKTNKELGAFFIVMNFSKGGYLSSSFWMFFLLIIAYSYNKKVCLSSKRN